MQRVAFFFIDFGRDKACNLHVAQRPLTEGIPPPGDTDVTGDVRNPARQVVRRQLISTPPILLPKRELDMLKRIIYHRVVLAGLMVVLTCLASSAEPLKIGMVAPLTGSYAEEGLYSIQGAKL